MNIRYLTHQLLPQFCLVSFIKNSSLQKGIWKPMHTAAFFKAYKYEVYEELR